MARPKTIKQGRKLNLYMPNEVIKDLFALATENDQSMSAFAAELIAKAKAKLDKRKLASL